MSTGSSQAYHLIRSSLAVGSETFKKNANDDWFNTEINGSEVKGNLQLSPDPNQLTYLNPNDLEQLQEQMEQLLVKMSDLTADVSDILSIQWLKGERTSKSGSIFLTIDDFLKYRGLKPKKSRNRKAGYRDDQRSSISYHLNILKNLWVTIKELKVKEMVDGQIKRKTIAVDGPLIFLDARIRKIDDETGEEEIVGYEIRPGLPLARILYDTNQVALLSQKALSYDHQKFKLEKRLTRYLSYLWRVRQQTNSYTKPISVKKILKQIKMEVNYQRPSRTRNRFEDTLDRLENDGVIAEWRYIDFVDIDKKKWIEKWLESNVIIFPPDEIVQHYEPMQKSPDILENDSGRKSKNNKDNHIGKKLMEKRKSLNLTMSQVAEQIGINVSTISRIENGKSNPRGKNKKRILDWIDGKGDL